MDRLTSMSVFVKAAELGSFAAAAEALSLSAQMVAKHVAWLEARLGVRLLNRTTRRQSLTDIGRSYYERCRMVLAEAEAADAIVLDMKATPSGVIRVNAPVTFGSYTLAPFLTHYLGNYPDTQVELTLSDRLVDPIEEGFEVIIRIGELADSSMLAWPLRPYRLIACASPDYVAREGLPAVPAELAHHACLVYGIWSPAAPCRWVFHRAGKTEEVRPQGRFRSNDWKALLHAAIEGYGVTLGPEDVLREEIRQGRLVQVLPEYEGPARPMHVLVPAGRRQTVKIKSVVDALRMRFGESA
ncbi:LysR family transcriptional regulator [Dickeya fangzhongdai]|uniref:LysR family transcriptional regulator n=2 Tax=Dickeya fangzhongdai TaxID=1778540 RepID=A0A2K8QT22_9GAMM|nr:LysR family transcriptional regulator [Dickeya fangzhongdai]ATZ96613.1 LysR family transcriptional regulator [Dickeya fangzhongdai]QOH50053.1 LysR family transcriptional regulator [Dickeya fangzhongdai]QOH54357.1 LysR family transcriptional regulator [Dickeya fangzhongdai]WOY02309.1 LysR family transcriptional regulator [Dickeya fangzhongdai]WOY06770.1 LysR family transcriptional regulator [Dickeya fangzhongdai]